MSNKKSSKKTAKKTAGKRGSKGGGASDFIRSMPTDMPASEVVEAGKKKGLAFSTQLVYNVRSTARGNGSQKKPKKARKKASTAMVVYNPATGERETQFKQIVADLGVIRSRELMGEVEKAIQDVIAG